MCEKQDISGRFLDIFGTELILKILFVVQA